MTSEMWLESQYSAIQWQNIKAIFLIVFASIYMLRFVIGAFVETKNKKQEGRITPSNEFYRLIKVTVFQMIIIGVIFASLLIGMDALLYSNYQLLPLTNGDYYQLEDGKLRVLTTEKGELTIDVSNLNGNQVTIGSSNELKAPKMSLSIATDKSGIYSVHLIFPAQSLIE